MYDTQNQQKCRINAQHKCHINGGFILYIRIIMQRSICEIFPQTKWVIFTLSRPHSIFRLHIVDRGEPIPLFWPFKTFH